MNARPIKLTDRQAAAIATATLTPRRVPPSTIRSWKNRGMIVGGHGWIDGEHLDHFLTHLKLGDSPMIAGTFAKRSDLVQHGSAFSVPAHRSCPYCNSRRQMPT